MYRFERKDGWAYSSALYPARKERGTGKKKQRVFRVSLPPLLDNAIPPHSIQDRAVKHRRLTLVINLHPTERRDEESVSLSDHKESEKRSKRTYGVSDPEEDEDGGQDGSAVDYRPGECRVSSVGLRVRRWGSGLI